MYILESLECKYHGIILNIFYYYSIIDNLTNFNGSDTLFGIVKLLDPIGVEKRLYVLNRLLKGEYIVPGPDYIWSLDGHDKLKHWGFEIYAAIDAYSRYIIWIYVGISNKTTTSIATQYLTSVKAFGKHPQILQSDHGVEAPIGAEVHYALSWITQPNALLQDVYYFGTSIGNIRIEA